jgi:hypothetical protein
LFTLTDQGAILTYHRYTHDTSDGFSAAVDEFAERLAKAMNTCVASTGQVSTLVAKDWYDDGAIRTESALDLQSTDGVVRTLMRTAGPASVIGQLQDIVGGQQAMKSVLGSLLFVEELTTRPAIIAPFVEAYGFEQDVPFQERFRLAILARTAGLAESARAVLNSLRPNSLPARLKRFECAACRAFHGIGSYEEVFDVLIDHNPTLALRTLRITRSRDVQRDSEESQPHRRQALAKIHKLLGRDRLAAQFTSTCDRP